MLTARKEKFVDEYIATGNASLAARRAGFSPKHPEKAGDYACILLKRDEDIKKLLESKRGELKKTIEAERAELYPKSKEEFASEAFHRSKTVNHPPTASKYYELGGKALGLLSDEKQSDTPIYQVVHNELNVIFITARTKRVATQSQLALTTNQSTLDNKSNSNETVSQEKSSVSAEGGEGPTQGGKLSLIPPDKSLTILNSPDTLSTNTPNEEPHA